MDRLRLAPWGSLPEMTRISLASPRTVVGGRVPSRGIDPVEKIVQVVQDPAIQLEEGRSGAGEPPLLHGAWREVEVLSGLLRVEEGGPLEQRGVVGRSHA